jgi:HAD superfamily hydrolase (TIGR01509 family)
MKGAAVTVRALVWDMDGTLLDSSAAVPAAFAATLVSIGGPVVSAADVIAVYPLGPAEVILAHLAGRPVPAAAVETYYRELEAVSVRAYPGVADAVGRLRARGAALAVFTGASTRAAVTLLASAGLSADVLIGGDQIGRPKPAPDGLLLAASQLGIEPGDLAYIGDATTDLRAARAAGCHAAAAAWGHMYDPAEPADSVLAAPPDALDLLA